MPARGPVPAAFAGPNRKCFGSKRGVTWLNAISDRGMGRGAKVVSGTIRDSLHMVDVIFGLDGGKLPCRQMARRPGGDSL